MAQYLELFLIFGFAGFLLETINNYFVYGRFVYAGDKFWWGVPYLPIYAVGGLLMHISVTSLAPMPWYLNILFTTWVVIIWEYMTGLFCVRFLNRRYWDYRERKVNLGGHVCLRSAWWWLVLVSIYYFWVI